VNDKTVFVDTTLFVAVARQRTKLRELLISARGTTLAMTTGMEKALTRRRVIDFVAAAGGVLVLLFALAILELSIRRGVMGGAPDLGALGDDMNYVGAVVGLFVAQAVRGDLFDNIHFVVFTATAAVLVVFLMRM
jgi:hypothetical protein